MEISNVTRNANCCQSGAVVATITQLAASKSTEALAQTDRPDFFKAKDMAEAGFIYGLPIVMNYAVMYAYAVGSQFGTV